MNSSATQDFLSEVLDNSRISAEKLAYFQTRLAGRVHQAMLKAFEHHEHETNFTRKVLARRIGRKPEQITRWFSYPGNLTLSTASDIFVGMGYEIESFTLVNLDTGARMHCPEAHANWSWTSMFYPSKPQSSSEAFQIGLRECSAREQSAYYWLSEEPCQRERRLGHSVLSGFSSPSSEIGKAEAAQFRSSRAVNTTSSGPQA